MKTGDSVSAGDSLVEVSLFVERSGEVCASGCSASYLRLRMFDAVILSSMSMGGSASETVLTENISLNFARYEYCYTQLLGTGELAPEVCHEFNIVENVEP